MGLNWLCGEAAKGSQNKQQKLVTGNNVLGIRKVKLTSPVDGCRSCIITKMKPTELARHFGSWSALHKVLAVITACVGGSLLAYIIYRKTARWVKNRRQKFEKVGETVEGQGSQNNQRNDAAEPKSEHKDEGISFARFDNAHKVIRFPNGYMAMYTDCVEVLPLSDTCPVCTANIVFIIPPVSTTSPLRLRRSVRSRGVQANRLPKIRLGSAACARKSRHRRKASAETSRQVHVDENNLSV